MDGKYLSLNQSRIAALTLAVAGLCLVGWGMSSATNIRYQLKADQVEQIHQAGERLQDVEVPIDRPALVGSSMIKASLGLLALVGAAIVAPDRPKKLPTIAMEDELAEVAAGAVPVPKKDEILSQIKHSLASYLQQQPWLMQCVKAKMIIITGASGSKKSRTAAGIAFLRAIHGDEVIILSPHAQQDQAAGTWIAGELFDESDILGERDRALGANRTQLTTPRQVTILDEFTGWCDGSYPLLGNFGREMISHGCRGTRKQNACDIFIVHSADGAINKGLFGGDALESGLLTLSLHTAMVIHLEADTDPFGDTIPAGRGWWKPANTPFADESARKPLTLPSWLDPAFLRSQFQEWLYEAGIGLKAGVMDTSKRPPKIDPRIQEAVDRLVNPANPALADTLDRLFNLSDDDAPIDGLGAKEIDWETAPPKAKEFLQYCLSKGAKSADAYGWFEVERLFTNYGRNHNFTRPQFRDFLAALQVRKLGQFRDKTEKHWKPLIHPSDL